MLGMTDRCRETAAPCKQQHAPELCMLRYGTTELMKQAGRCSVAAATACGRSNSWRHVSHLEWLELSCSNLLLQAGQLLFSVLKDLARIPAAGNTANFRPWRNMPDLRMLLNTSLMAEYV